MARTIANQAEAGRADLTSRRLRRRRMPTVRETRKKSRDRTLRSSERKKPKFTSPIRSKRIRSNDSTRLALLDHEDVVNRSVHRSSRNSPIRQRFSEMYWFLFCLTPSVCLREPPSNSIDRANSHSIGDRAVEYRRKGSDRLRHSAGPNDADDRRLRESNSSTSCHADTFALSPSLSRPSCRNKAGIRRCDGVRSKPASSNLRPML